MNIDIWQTIVLALLQGVTELFPISSLGHTVIIPGLLGWGNMTTDTACGGESCFVPLITALHLGTSFALLFYFWRDWLQVAKTLVVTAKDWKRVRKGTPEWVSWLIIVGTIPAGVLGILLEHVLKHAFASPLIASTFLVVNGSALFFGEAMRRRSEAKLKALPPREREAHFRRLDSLTFKEALLVGTSQALSLIPGFSRSGMTIVGGLIARLTHEDAARYSFLLGTPIILAAAALEVPQLLHLPGSTLLLVLFGAVLSGIAAFLSTKFLLKYFETGRLDPFAYYCWGAGLISIILFFTVFSGRA
ncbi:undecaprenyl-diphosphate phosphatase [Ktedonospora formicarum]|uniref:Undecaprenyl-diphosphatase n=1 Tax=Ktedonospora formicarum TaxID=2778364 RepID=A0A8J3MPK1_9CHLR|nr:undecaprenyl-diphosphate phosphatase [Ktedonospora formicarum]GHO43902.1 undecaprenyl-diphosphatase [Ktedonospora formicarum]